jgi:anti-sigma factor ChrR (cupin superfamily)
MGSVLGWILNLTQSRGIDRLRSGKRAEPRDEAARDAFRPPEPWTEPDWSEVAPGISCKLLAVDAESGCISMLVRLAPGAHYPAHRHGGVEELHLLDGELWVDYRKLVPGDYSRREATTEDYRVWSKTGCTCFLMTSAEDELR